MTATASWLLFLGAIGLGVGLGIFLVWLTLTLIDILFSTAPIEPDEDTLGGRER